MTPRSISITDNAADRWRTTLQLIASLPIHACDDARNADCLTKAVSAARAALTEPEHDPLCEVLREPETFRSIGDVVSAMEFRKRNRCSND